MSRTLAVSEPLFERLEQASRRYGLNSIEELLEQWQLRDDAAHREQIVRRIDALRGELFNKYGEMRDSVELLREDRER